MSTHARGGTHWASGRSWYRLVPALLAALAVALALGVHGLSAEAAARPVAAATGHGHEPAQRGAQRDREQHRESNRHERERPRAGRSVSAAGTSVGRPASRGTAPPAQLPT